MSEVERVDAWSRMFNLCATPVECERWQRCLRERPLTPDEQRDGAPKGRA